VQQNLGEFTQTFENGTTGSNFKLRNETVTLSLARELAGPVSFGANIKWFGEHSAMVSGDSSGPIEGTGFFVDLGAVTAVEGLLDGKDLRDSAYFGISVQDIGGKLRYESVGQAIAIAQWVRVGGAYAVVSGDSGASTFRGTLSAEYSRIINPGPNQDGSYGGIGFEAMLVELLSLRVGARFLPPPQLPSFSSNSWTTFGIGVNLPLKKIGMNVPLIIGIDYAKLPEVENDFDVNKAENAFEFRVAYTGNVFGR
jgi:hypothetical protein